MSAIEKISAGDSSPAKNVSQKVLSAPEVGPMTRPYSNDLRERVVRAHLDGEPIRSVADAAAPTALGPAGVRGGDLDQDQQGAATGLGAEGPSPEVLRTARAPAHPDLPGRPAPGRAERAVRVRRADQPALLPGLGRTAPGADAPAR